MKKWVVVLEFNDEASESDLVMTEADLRQIIAGRLNGELPNDVSYDIRNVSGPHEFPAKAKVQHG